MKFKAILIFLSFFILSCGSQRYIASAPGRAYEKLDAADKILADTLIMKALDNEGLYTVTGRLKPMSSVTDLQLIIAQKDSTLKGTRDITDLNSKDLAKLKRYQRVVNALQFPDLKFIIAPYRITNGNKRLMHINLYRPSLIDSLVRANQTFYGQFGIVNDSQPEIIISLTEYESAYERFRSYGYLFGYPEHAVSFFVNASITSDQTKQFVQRDFFQIPVYSNKTGHFVYALPKGTKPGITDSVLYKRAAFYLEKYRLMRKQNVQKNRLLKPYQLLKDLQRKDG